MFVVEDSGKMTVSLGGVCSVGCKFCYITVKDFNHPPVRTVQSVVDEVAKATGVKCICVSCDIDPLLRPNDNLSLMHILADRNPSTVITFTTRLLPSVDIYNGIKRLADECMKRRQIFVPAVSLVSFSYPNKLEHKNRVPSSQDRLNLIRRFVDDGIPCIVALRPTFPFEVVPGEETVKLIDALPQGVASVLGEAFLVDKNKRIAEKIDWTDIDKLKPVSEKMTFNTQPAAWNKYILPEEINFAKTISNNRGLPYFLRGMTAFNYTAAHWDFDARVIRHDPNVSGLRDNISLLP